MSVAALVSVMDIQADILEELRNVAVCLKEAMRDSRLDDLQDYMSDLRRLSVSAQAAEAKRARVAAELAEQLGCGPTVSEMCGYVSGDERAPLEESRRRLGGAVSALKTENQILSMLMNEAKNLNDMMLSEWRRASDSAPGPVGFDSRG